MTSTVGTLDAKPKDTILEILTIDGLMPSSPPAPTATHSGGRRFPAGLVPLFQKNERPAGFSFVRHVTTEASN